MSLDEIQGLFAGIAVSDLREAKGEVRAIRYSGERISLPHVRPTAYNGPRSTKIYEIVSSM